MAVAGVEESPEEEGEESEVKSDVAAESGEVRGKEERGQQRRVGE